MPVCCRLLFIFLISLCSAVQAVERRYQAALENSHWNLTANSALLCRLEHQIPQFGRAAFVHRAGRGLQLKLLTHRRFKKGTEVALRSETSSWNTVRKPVMLAEFKTGAGNKLFKVPGTVAEQVFHELREGYRPGFLFNQDSPLIATISNVRFVDAAEKFEQCVAGLHRDNFHDVRVSAIHFESDAEFASVREEQTAFSRMLNYLRVDSAISEIVVTGHADHTGLACYNKGLSERRASYVYDLLLARGIDSRLLRVEYQGEHRPTSKGNTKKSLASNRRVTVELRR